MSDLYHMVALLDEKRRENDLLKEDIMKLSFAYDQCRKALLEAHRMLKRCAIVRDTELGQSAKKWVEGNAALLKLPPLSPEVQEARKPQPPEKLVGALQDRVHVDAGRVRHGRTVKTRKGKD